MKSLLFLLTNITTVLSLTCDDIRQYPDDMKITIDELYQMKEEEIASCLPHLGKDELPTEDARYIWETLIKNYKGINNIPDDKLAQLNWITKAIEPSEIGNLTINNIDVVENFGKDHNLNAFQLLAIAERIKEDWGGKEPKDYTYYDLVAMNTILCAFNKSDIEQIHPRAYKDAASTLGTIKACDLEVLSGLAQLAMHPSAFGDPSKWSKSTINTVGIVLNGLPADVRSNMNVDGDNKQKEAFPLT